MGAFRNDFFRALGFPLLRQQSPPPPRPSQDMPGRFTRDDPIPHVAVTQVSWLSWWAQTILSTVAFIILLFSNAVTNRSARGNILGNGVALALGSLACSAASVCW